MNALDKFKRKNVTPLKGKVTSVNIRADQYEFLLKHDLKISEIMRDAIDQLMKKFKQEK